MTTNDTIEEPNLALARPEPPEPAPGINNRTNEVNQALLPAYQKASALELTEAEGKALMEPFQDHEVEIRPHDGLLYIPHIAISDRLCQIFGPGKWCMVKRREWIEGNRIYGEWVLLIRGCFVGESIGCMDYHPGNAKMNYSDALEGTRGECIRRIAGKELGCGAQVWRPAYTRQWQAKYAVNVKGRWERRLVDYTAPREATPPEGGAPAQNVSKANPEPAKPPVKNLRKRFMEVIEPHKVQFVDLAIKAGWLLPTEGLADLPDRYIPKDKATLDKLMKDLTELPPTP